MQPGYPAASTIRAVREALYFTESDEANRLIATQPLALLIGFALDQQVTVPTAFLGPLKLTERIGELDAKTIAAMDPDELEMVFRERPAIHRFPGSMRSACRSCAPCSPMNTTVMPRECDGRDGPADLKKRIGSLPGFGAMKITGLGSVLALQFGVAAAQELVPDYPCLGKIHSSEDLAEYQTAKRAYKSARREQERAAER